MTRASLGRAGLFASLVAATLICALWARGFWKRDSLQVGQAGWVIDIQTFPHHIVIVRDYDSPRSVLRFSTKPTQYPASYRYLQLRFSRDLYGWSFCLPLWLPLLFTLAYPAWRAGEQARKRRTSIDGVCPRCGYDLRASPDRCPECGGTTVPGIGPHPASVTDL